MYCLKTRTFGDFPGGPGVKNLYSHAGDWVQSLSRELKSHKLCGAAKTLKIKTRTFLNIYITTGQ